MAMHTILWRRLDGAGHDACRLIRRDGGWRLEGAAAFRHEAGPACLSYGLDCDTEWQTRAGMVSGWVGTHPVDVRITRARDGWTLNGRFMADLENCVDLDFGFTPATNLSQVRRVELDIGQSADVPVAWLDLPAGTLVTLQQRYERRSATAYWYEAPRFDYVALLEVDAVGFVTLYPRLWQAEP